MLPEGVLNQPGELDGYEILGPIGQGGMGRVDLARQRNLGRLVAIKWLVKRPDDQTTDWVACFQREAAAMARVSHPNILTIFDFGVALGVPYLVLEYVEEGDMRHLMRGGRLPASQVRTIMRDVNGAIVCLHRSGIIHRDIKPENILMKGGNIPRVADFGLSILMGGQPPTTREGTTGYASPEQRYGLPLDERTDQYALGALAYELLTGEQPVGSYLPPSKLEPSLSPAIDKVIMKALRESPGARHARVEEFADALDQAFAETATTPATTGIPGRRPDSQAGDRTSTRRLAVMGAAVLVMGLLTALYFLPWNEPMRISDSPDPPVTGVTSKTDEKGETVKPPPPAADSEPTEESLANLWAYLLWIEQGRPTGQQGEKVSQSNYLRAKELVREELESLAFEIWTSRGSLKFNDPVRGKAESDRNWKAAHERLYDKLRAAIESKPAASNGTEASPLPESNQKAP